MMMIMSDGWFMKEGVSQRAPTPDFTQSHCGFQATVDFGTFFVVLFVFFGAFFVVA